MYGIPSALTYDLAVIAQNEKLARAELARQAKSLETKNGLGLGLAVRHGLGRALIAIGQTVHGKRAVAHDHSTSPSTGILRLAR